MLFHKEKHIPHTSIRGSKREKGNLHASEIFSTQLNIKSARVGTIF